MQRIAGQKIHDTLPTQPNYGRRRLMAAGGVVLALVGGKVGMDKISDIRASNKLYNQTKHPNAMQHYLDGDIDPTKVTVVVASGNSNADTLAYELHGEGDIRALGDIIDVQADANHIPGVQSGEKFVVPIEELKKEPENN